MACLATVFFAMLAFPAAGNPEDKDPGRDDPPQSAEARDRENPPQSANGREAPADEPAAEQSDASGEPSQADDRDKEPPAASATGKDEPGKDEPRKDEPRKDEPRRDEPTKPAPTTAASEHQAPAAAPEVQPTAPAAPSTAPAATRRPTAKAISPRRPAKATPRRSRSTGGPAAGLDITVVPAPTAPVADAGARTGRPSAPRSRAQTGGRSRVPASVRQVIEVIPKPLFTLLGLLAGLSLAFGAASALTARRAHRLERERRRLAADVGLLQSALHPQLPEDLNLTSISAVYRAADGPAAGGDFYDAFPLPRGRTGIVLGSLQSHGRAALPLTMLVRYTLRAQLESGLEPRLALENADRVLLEQLRGQLAGAVVATFDPALGYLTYAVAGHPQPVIAGGHLRPVTAVGSRPLGTGRLAGSRQTTVALGAGTAAIFHTEGLLTALPDVELGTLGGEATADDVLRALPRRHPVARDLAVLVLRPHAGVMRPRAAQYEQLAIRGSGLGSARDFLEACGVNAHDAATALSESRSAIAAHGGAVLEARIDARGATASVAAAPAPPAPVGASGYLPASR